jgi:uncharacterized Zn-binding protein involved in type VI secretion
VSQQKIARIGDLLSHGGAVIQACGHSTTQPGNKRITYKTAVVICARHKRQTIVTGCLNSSVKADGNPSNGADKQIASYGSKCSCKATVIARSTNSSVDGNSH